MVYKTVREQHLLEHDACPAEQRGNIETLIRFEENRLQNYASFGARSQQELQERDIHYFPNEKTPALHVLLKDGKLVTLGAKHSLQAMVPLTHNGIYLLHQMGSAVDFQMIFSGQHPERGTSFPSEQYN